VYLATIKYVTAKTTMLQHRNIHKFSGHYLMEGHSKTDHISLGNRQVSIVLDVRFFRVADCDNGH
jgi:hypothetical protein